MATAATGALTVAFDELRRRTADKFGDLLQVAATANGTADRKSVV